MSKYLVDICHICKNISKFKRLFVSHLICINLFESWSHRPCFCVLQNLSFLQVHLYDINKMIVNYTGCHFHMFTNNCFSAWSFICVAMNKQMVSHAWQNFFPRCRYSFPASFHYIHDQSHDQIYFDQITSRLL